MDIETAQITQKNFGLVDGTAGAQSNKEGNVFLNMDWDLVIIFIIYLVIQLLKLLNRGLVFRAYLPLK